MLQAPPYSTYIVDNHITTKDFKRRYQFDLNLATRSIREWLFNKKDLFVSVRA